MKLEALTRADTQKVIRWWASDGGEGEDMYVSAYDCPTVELALAFYKDTVGDDWMTMMDEADKPYEKIIPCCDHEMSECDQDATTRQCNKAVLRRVWAFEV